MVEHSPATKLMGDLTFSIGQAALRLENKDLSKQEIADLINRLEQFNQAIDPSTFWEDKKPAMEEGMNQKIEKALHASILFQGKNMVRAGQRNVDQAIVSLLSTLKAQLKRFDRNLRGLKEYKIGKKAEKSDKSKES